MSIEEHIIVLETAALERWNAGDPDGSWKIIHNHRSIIRPMEFDRGGM